MTETPDLLRTAEAAELLNVTQRTLRQWVAKGRISHLVLPSGHLRFRRQDVDALLVPVPATTSEVA